MDKRRIAALLAPFLEAREKALATTLSDTQLAQVSSYLDLLVKWNAKINLTSVRDPEEMVTRHFGESFFLARHLRLEATDKILDVGSGPGFPGLPIKIYAQEPRMTLIESQSKKAVFLSEVIRALRLSNVNVFRGRAEEFREAASVVTLRAVERFASAVLAASKLLAAGGRIALLIGAAQAAAAYRLLPWFDWNPPEAIPQSTSRVILMGTNQIEEEPRQ